MPGAYLIYVYRHRAAEAAVSSSDLKPGDLLIPPAFVNQLGWTKGYFLPIGSAVVRPEDRLPHPCFFDGLRGTYVDASGQPIEHRSEPCGDWGLGNHRSLDVKISDALGITQAPDR